MLTETTLSGTAPKTFQTRDYQLNGINAVAELAGKGVRRIVFQLATGGGKSFIFSQLTTRFQSRIKKRVVIAVNRDTLLEQACETLTSVGIKPGRIVAGYKNIVFKQGEYLVPFNRAETVVCMVETLYNRLKKYQDYLGDVGMLVIDEVHLANFNKIYDYFPDSLIVGFTATPVSANKREPLNKYFDEIISPITIQSLIDQGYLAKNISIKIKGGVNRKSLKLRGGEFDEKIMAGLYSNTKHVENCVAQYEKYCLGEKTAVFNCNIEHSKIVAEAFVRKGYNARHLDGNDTHTHKAETLKWFAETDDAILCSVALLTTGWDEPSIQSIIVNRATMSLPLWLQMCLDKKTEILTIHGWKTCHDVKNGDIVASFNMHNSQIEYGACTNKVIRPLHPSESIFSLKSPFVDISVSNKHALVVRGRTKKRVQEWKLMDADQVAEIKHTYEIPIAGQHGNPDNPKLSDDQLRFLGWFLSDGSLDKSNNAIRIYQAESQPKDHHKSIVDSIEGCGFKYSKSVLSRSVDWKNQNKINSTIKYSNIIRYSVSKRQWESIAPFIDKNISDELMTISRRQLLILLSTLNLGDGVKRKKVSWVPRSLTITAGNNLRFAERLQILCITNGLKCNISQHHYNKMPLYNLHIKDRSYASIKGKNELDGNRLVDEGYKNTEVWCVSTHNETLVTRRNGKVAIIGNCGRGSRPIPGIKSVFKIIDLGHNITNLLDWNYPHDWRSYFHYPEQAGKRKKAAAPTKFCSSCEAMIHLSARTCPFCGHNTSAPEQYDKAEIQLEVLTKGIDINKLIEKNQGYKPYRALHLAKNSLIARFRSQYKGTTLSQDIRDLLNQKYQGLVQTWCKTENKDYNRFHKSLTKKWLFDELDRIYGRLETLSNDNLRKNNENLVNNDTSTVPISDHSASRSRNTEQLTPKPAQL